MSTEAKLLFHIEENERLKKRVETLTMMLDVSAEVIHRQNIYIENSKKKEMNLETRRMYF